MKLGRDFTYFCSSFSFSVSQYFFALNAQSGWRTFRSHFSLCASSEMLFNHDGMRGRKGRFDRVPQLALRVPSFSYLKGPPTSLCLTMNSSYTKLHTIPTHSSLSGIQLFPFPIAILYPQSVILETAVKFPALFIFFRKGAA